MVATTPYHAEFIAFIISQPDLRAMASYRLSHECEVRLSHLLDLGRDGELTPDEQQELDEYLQLEQIMLMMKYSAYQKLYS